MKQYKNVQGSMKTVPQVEINVDTVYVRSNIKRITVENSNIPQELWEYDESQYELHEYAEISQAQGYDNAINDLVERGIL
ncbi:MAG: hypothetical protein RRZ69_07630 [Clostridia bacterium]